MKPLHLIGIATIGLVLLLSTVFFSAQPTQQAPQDELSLGAFNTVGGKVYSLYGGGIGSSDTSITLSSFQQPVSNYLLAMADFGDIGYVTIEPGSSSRQEFVSFTGLTQNSDGTATLTGVVRGLAPVPPYTASTTIQKAHAGGSNVVISNPPQLYEELATRSNDEWITGAWGFQTTATTSDVCNTANELCNKTYVDSLSVAGAPTSTEDTLGIVELATNLEMGTSTASSSSGRPLVLLSRYSTTTPTASGCSSGPCVVASYFQGLSASWFSSTIDYVIGRITVTNATTTNATTTNLTLSSPGITGGLLKTSATGIVTKASTSTDYQAQRLTFLSTTDVNPASGAYATSSVTIDIPANFLTGSSTLEFEANGSGSSSGGVGSCSVSLRFASGVQFASISNGPPDNGNTYEMNFRILVQMNNSVAAQNYIGTSVGVSTDTITGETPGRVTSSEGTGTTDFASAQTFSVVIGPAADLDADCLLTNWHAIIDP